MLHRRAHHVEVGGVAPFEEGVEHRHERVEVLVEGRRLHAQPSCYLRQAEAVDPLLGHHVRGDGEDFVDGLLATATPAIKGCRRGREVLVAHALKPSIRIH